MTVGEHARRGLWQENPALVQLLGLCPLLAVSNSAVNGVGLGVATLVALLLSSSVVSLTRHRVPRSVRLPVYVLVLATAVSIVDLGMEAWLPALHERLGIFVPLIVTNCAVLARAESFAARHPPRDAVLDALFVGLGFAAVLLALGALREVLGSGAVFAGADLLLGAGAEDLRWQLAEGGVRLALLPPGAFLALALLAALHGRCGRPRRAVAVAPPQLPQARS